MNYGIQISSVKPYLQTEADVRSSVATLSAMGYRYTQLQWLNTAIPADAVASILREYGMTSLGTQEKYDDCFGQFDYFVALNRACGSSDICFSGIPAHFEKMSDYLSMTRSYAARASSEGMSLSYHPVATDFRLLDGVPAIDVLLSEFPDLPIVADTNQLTRAHVDVFAWISRHAGRVKIVHFKDMVAPVEGSPLTPVGQGCIDFPSILSACRSSGVSFVLAEQESWAKDAFLCMQESLEYIRKIW